MPSQRLVFLHQAAEIGTLCKGGFTSKKNEKWAQHYLSTYGWAYLFRLQKGCFYWLYRGYIEEIGYIELIFLVRIPPF